MTPELRMGWAVDFLDDPADGLSFRYWSGSGDLTIGTGADAVVYQGTNGVIDISAPEERSGEAMRLTAVMDATDSAVRQQLRHDLGPLRVRIRWLWYDSRIDTSNANDGITPLTDNLSGYWTFYDFMLVPNSNVASIANNSVHPWRYRSVGSEVNFSTGVTYYARFLKNAYTSGITNIFVFDTEANATGATGLPWQTGQAGKLNFTSNGANIVGGTFDASEVRHPAPAGWRATGKEFIGRLSSPVLEGAKYTVDIESQISDILRGRVLNWSNDMQQARHPGDKGMEYLAEYAEGIDTKWPP